MELKGNNMVDLKKNNRAKVLQILMKYGPISRAEISEISGLTPPSVSTLTNELIDDGLVVDIGYQDEDIPSVGRKRKNLRIASESKLVVGVEIGVKKILLGLMNLDGEILKQSSIILKNSEPDFIIKNVITAIKDIIKDYPVQKIIGIGIGATGLVDNINGVVIKSPNLHWQKVSLADALEKEIPFPVYIENNVRLMALGENSFFYNWGDISNMILVHAGYGIGCGIILNGTLYYGRSFGAGELGHTTVIPSGPVCSCGKRGCLEAIASGKAVVSLYEHRKGQLDWDFTEGINELMTSAEQGEREAVQILEESGNYMGIAMSNLVNLFSPELLILHGSLFESDIYLQEVKEQLRANNFATDHKIPFKKSQVGEELVILGAGALVIQNSLIYP